MNDEARIPQIRAIRRRMFRWLMVWGAGSMAAGAVAWGAMYTVGSPGARSFLSAVAAQLFVWGALETMFAAAGLSPARRGNSSGTDPIRMSNELRDAGNLLRTLRFSLTINYFLVLIALVLLLPGMVFRSPLPAGHGSGLLIHAVFLLVFDRRFRDEMRRATS